MFLEYIQVSLRYVYHRVYFTYKLKTPIIKTHRKLSKEPVVNYSSRYFDIIPATLYSIPGNQIFRRASFNSTNSEKANPDIICSFCPKFSTME